MKAIRILGIVLLWCGQLSAQNTYSLLMASDITHDPRDVIELADGSMVALVNEYTGHYYTPDSQFYKGVFLKFSPEGDTTLLYPPLGDTLFGFNTIIKSNNGGYFITGISIFPDSTTRSLMLLEVDDQFNKLWTKHYFIDSVFSHNLTKLVSVEDGYFAFGHIRYSITGGCYPFLCRIDNFGNILRQYIYPDRTPEAFEYTFNPDKSRIWVFSAPSLDPINGSSIAVFDTNFNYLYSEALDENSASHYTHHWQNDTSFYLSFSGNRTGATSQDVELFIGLYDTLMNPIYLNEFGDYESNDYSAWHTAISYQNPDSIFYAGTIGVYFGYPPQGYTNYIMLGQTDEQLQERYRNYIGGDGYYYAEFIKATSDGGCFLGANRYNHTTLVKDAIFMKLDSKGELVYLVGQDVPNYRFMLYPNPAAAQLHIQTAIPTYSYLIRDINGKLIDEGISLDKMHVVNVSHYSTGTYMITFIANGELIETQKFIKQ